MKNKYNLAPWGKKKIAGDHYSLKNYQGSVLRHAVNNFTWQVVKTYHRTVFSALIETRVARKRHSKERFMPYFACQSEKSLYNSSQ
jgi:hypothetical protein